MNEKALRTLEFYKIRDLLEAEATSAPGKARCRMAEPSRDISEIESWQNETSAALSRILRKGSPSFSRVRDIGASCKRLEVSGSLNQTELLQVADLLENAAAVKSYGARERDDDPSDLLEHMFSALSPLPHISREIRRCLISDTEVADDASAQLRKIRRSKTACNDKIHSQLSSLLTGSLRNVLQDNVITMRNGRYCVPVKAEFRSSVPGMIHDQSSTGATVFIEPMSVVKLNNEIRELELQEEAEINRILSELSVSAAAELPYILSDIHILTELDVIFARGRLAVTMNATRPVFNTEGRIKLRNARHPLINKKHVVPINVELGDTFDLLIVTGPNTGGKTVSLKTTGLLTLMGLAGLHIPCSDRSELSVFNEVFADIGDEQSIEQSLSTFSSHMKNIVSFLGKADSFSLVLFDELGAGTDPTEGAALAISVLSHLHARGIRTMATTHYSELKVYAIRTPGVENACCEFDVESLRPTYRLLIGLPGKSNAFAISSKLGLSPELIEDAKSRIGSHEAAFEDVIARLESDRAELDLERERLSRERAELDRRKKNLRDGERAADEKRDRIIREAEDEARGILTEAKEYADRTLREFRKAGKNGLSISDLERKRTRIREKISSTSRSDMDDTRKERSSLRPGDLRPGDSVRVISMNVNGIARSEADARGMVSVQMGILNSKVHISDLIKTEMPDEIHVRKGPGGTGSIKMSKSLSVGHEIKVIGKTVDDAVAELDKYLDDAYLAHLESVRIVHGKGTGALRKGIHTYLKRHPHVSGFELAGYGEGDAGVTIVKFKK